MSSAISGVILCLAYIFGLLSTAFFWGGYAVLGLGVIGAVILPNLWRKGPKVWVWVAAGIVGLLATFYFYARLPQPAANDISKFVQPIDGKAQVQLVSVRGKVDSTPRLTRNQRAQFWLNVTQLDDVVGNDRPIDIGKEVTGKLYVTVPLLQVTGINPGDEVGVMGTLYKPKPPANPGSFDFKAYLAKEGSFAGLKGRQVILADEQLKSTYGWWKIRQRIIRAQANWLGVPEGPLVSAMVLGGQTVNLYLPVSIRDQFAKVGLAHALAASGFQVSLILGIVLALTRRFPARGKFACGVAALLIFLGLTGLQPSVLRAVLMGVAALFALVAERKVKPLGSLLLAATLLLLINPLWIWDLSFQLSFLATLGLLVTAPILIKWLDWLPPLFGSAIAIPLAASLWTLPLQLYIFNVVSPYSLLVNLLATPLIALVSIGAFISAIAALIWPLAGSALAWLLYYPTHWLILLVSFFSELPGNTVAVGDISEFQLFGLGGLICLVWLWRWWHKRWWVAAIMAIAVVVIPVWQTKSILFQVTVLSTTAEPVMVIQDEGKAILVNSGDSNAARFTVLPFLRQEAINKIDWAIATKSKSTASSGWSTILEDLAIANFYDNPDRQEQTNNSSQILSLVQTHQGIYQPLANGQTLQIGSISVNLIDPEAPVFKFDIQGQSWLLLGNLPPDQQKPLATKAGMGKTQVLWWSGERLMPDLLKVLQPAVAIAFSNSVDPDTATRLRRAKALVYTTNRDGAIQWTPDGGFNSTLELTENASSLL